MKKNKTAYKKEESVILVVEDSKVNIKILKDILKSQNYEIHTAKNGIQALAIVKKEPPDLILLDIVMPNMDGITVCELLKNSPTTKDIPVIFLTSRDNENDIVKGFEVGAVDYVTKPFNHLELLARVHTHLELKKARDNQKHLFNKLQDSLLQIKQLSGLLPICASCKKIRDNKGFWQQVEKYISDNAEVDFTHSLCPECQKKLYPDLYADENIKE